MTTPTAIPATPEIADTTVSTIAYSAPIPDDSRTFPLIYGRRSTPMATVTTSRSDSKHIRTPLEALSSEAQARVRDLMATLDPLGELIARARRRGSGTSTSTARPRPRRDVRMPKVGDVLRRYYKGRDITVRVLDSGFEFEGTRYRSLSAIAKAVTGAHWNGLLFFGIVRQER